MGNNYRPVRQYARKVHQARSEIIIVLTTLRPELPIGLVTFARRFCLLARDLGMKSSFKRAEGNLDQALVVNNGRKLDVEGCAHAVHGFAGAAQRRSEPVKGRRIDSITFQQFAQQDAICVGLQLAGAIERDILAALITKFAVPVGLTMAGEVKIRPFNGGHGHPSRGAARPSREKDRVRTRSLVSLARVWHMGTMTGKAAGACPRSTCGVIMPLSATEIASALSAIAGGDAVISDVSQMGAYLNEPRKRFHTAAAAVVTPRDVAGVQAILAWAHENHVGIIPQGGNTGLVGAQVPLRGDEVILSLARLDKIRAIDAAAGVMTAEAGVILENAHRAAEEQGMMFPLWLASQGSARIGGVLSSNAGGVNVLAYGNARELTMGVEAVLADGRLYNGLTSLKKDNTGYDLKDLLVGAEGTLGIITAATLKLFPLPQDYETALVNVASPAAALELFQLMRDRLGPRLNAFELIPWIGLDIQLRHGMLDADPSASASPWYALVEITRMAGTEPGALQASLEAAFEAGMISDATMAESLAQRTRMWAFREQMSECQSREGASIKHDVSVPIAAVPALIEEGTAAAERLAPDIRPIPFGHMGDGNIHFNFSQPVGADPKAFMAQYDEAMHEAIYEVVLKLGGSVSAEHGIGQLKTGLLKQVKDPVALEMMRAIKSALDPRGILNPGKMLG